MTGDFCTRWNERIHLNSCRITARTFLLMRFCPACHLLGQAISTIVSAVAQLERDLIRERVSAGVRHARASANPPRRRPKESK